MQDLDLAVIGNCSWAGLIDPRGRVVWACLPRLDGDPAFCSLLLPGDPPPQAGFYDIELQDFERSEQHYVPNTAILVTRLFDRHGASVEITDLAPRFYRLGRTYRPVMMVRHLRPLDGRPRIRIRLRPMQDWGAARPRITHGSNHIRYELPAYGLRLTTDTPVTYVLEEVPFLLEEPTTLVLGPDESLTMPIGEAWRVYHDETHQYWREWSRYLSIPYEWQDAVIRAAITLKLCSFEETGAVVAALTTSLPEAPHSGRNWDYRYCWLRDAVFVIHALNRLGATKTMEGYLRYIANIAALANGPMQPVYGITLQAALPERSVPSLAGFHGMGPVRTGNLAYLQRQNDVYGSVILACTQTFFDQRLIRPGTVELFERLEPLGVRATEVWDQPDAGLWEYRGRAHVHTHSALLCWVACDRLARIARRLGLPDRAAHWRGEAQRIRAGIEAQAWRPSRNSFVASFGGDDMDASLLLLHQIGFLRADDPRFAGTVAEVERVLKRGEFLLRYDAPDDFGVPETAFTVCTFWYIDALSALGRREEARALFETLLARRNHVGLLSEDIDPRDGTLWGNFPQTYSMVGIIDTAMRLSRSWEDAL